MMAHWAELDASNRVIRVTVGSNDEPDEGYGWLVANLGGRWMQTSYNAAVNGFRGKFAGHGDYYDEQNDRFRVFYEERVGSVHQFGMEFSYGRGAFIPEDDPDLVDVLNYVNGLALIDGPVLDVGAGIGNSSCALAASIGRVVHALEPNEASAYWLVENVAANNVTLVAPTREAIEEFAGVPFGLLFSNNLSDEAAHPMELGIAAYANANGVAGSVTVVRSNYGMPDVVRDWYTGWTVEATVGAFTVFTKDN